MGLGLSAGSELRDPCGRDTGVFMDGGLESRSAVCKQALYLLYHFYIPYVHIFVKYTYALVIDIPPNDHFMKMALARLFIGWIGDV